MKYLLIAALFFSLSFSYAQDDLRYDQPVIVKLKDGSKFEGIIVKWQYGEDLIIKTRWNDAMVIPADRIKNVNEKSKRYNVVEDGDAYSVKPFIKPYTYKETGIYFATDFNFIFANQGTRGGGTNGMALSISAGKKFNRFFSLGGGIGYDNYFWNTGERLMPIFAETRGFLHQTNESFYYKLKAGGSVAFKDEDFNITSAQGGWMIHPSIGFRFGQKTTKWTLDLGYKFQKARYVYDNTWQTSDQRITYKRLSIGLGILL